MFCLTACIYVLQVFFDMYAHLYLCTVYMYFASYLRNRKEQNDQFELITSSCTWNYQGSYSNQHCYIIKRVKKKSAPVSDLKSKNCLNDPM